MDNLDPSNLPALPPSSPPDREGTVNSTYLPDFIGWLKEAGKPGKPRLRADCGICFKKLDISTDVRDLIAEEPALPMSTAAFSQKHNLEAAVALPCGHVIGYQCMVQMGRAQPRQRWMELCPVCRYEILCGGCHKTIPAALCNAIRGPRITGVESFDPWRSIVEGVPLTDSERPKLSERSYCGVCVGKQALVAITSGFLGYEQCPLCANPARYARRDETMDEHRARLDKAVGWINAERMNIAIRMIFLQRDVRPDCSGADAAHDRRQARSAAFYDAMVNSAGYQDLSLRVFHTCPLLGIEVLPFEPRHAWELSIIAREIAVKAVDECDKVCWFLGMDEIMTSNFREPLPVTIPENIW
ncbi:hypothetical protein PG995_014281 [Apiospora arundinis]